MDLKRISKLLGWFFCFIFLINTVIYIKVMPVEWGNNSMFHDLSFSK